MASIEKFTTTFGKEITVSISDAGEPEKFSWEGAAELSESDLSDINDWVEDYSAENEGNDDD